MGAPAVIAGAAARSRTGRRVITVALVLGLLVNLALWTPLLAIPLAMAGQSTTATSTVAFDTGGAGPVTAGAWGYPLAGGYTKGRGFGPSRGVGCSFCVEFHEGYDMTQACGATVYAAGPGEVITAAQYQGYGNAVRIDHGGGVVTIYGHMAWGSLRVHVGERVTAGTPLGAEGNTGRSVGCHVHFEVRVHGTPVDPQPFMAARGLPLK